MGQEFEPFMKCCCAKPIDTHTGVHGGTNPVMEYGEYGGVNSNWIIKIQAVWRSKLQRMRYMKIREQSRKTGSQFTIAEVMETVSRRQVIEIDLLRNSNE